MGELIRLPPTGAGPLALADPRAAYTAAIASQAAYLLAHGHNQAAALAITPALRDALPAAMSAADARLAPVDPAEIMAKLTPALALTAGAGMTGGARTEWLAAAADALKGIPGDLLQRGVRAARATADHPSKIIPLILAEVKEPWMARRRERGSIRALVELANCPPPVSEPKQRCSPADARTIMREYGIEVEGDPCQPRQVAGASDARPRAPTRADYLRMGVDPAVLDAIAAEASVENAYSEGT